MLKKLIKRIVEKYADTFDYVKKEGKVESDLILAEILNSSYGRCLLVRTGLPKLYPHYRKFDYHIDFTQSFLREPHRRFFEEFIDRITLNIKVLGKLSEEVIFSTLLLDKVPVQEILKYWELKVTRIGGYYRHFVKYQDIIPTKLWEGIFQIVQFPTAELLLLEKHVLNNLQTVCCHQKLTKVTRNLWCDQPNYISKKRVKYIRSLMEGTGDRAPMSFHLALINDIHLAMYDKLDKDGAERWPD